MKESKRKFVTRRSMKFYYSGRSSDYISPSFGHGCLLDCAYCYLKRNVPNGLTVAVNSEEILSEILRHSQMDARMHNDFQKPNQVHPELIMYDISCNEDFALHWKYHAWKKIFTFFRDTDGIGATLATKVVPPDFWLEFDPKKKVRIRFSLMPQYMSNIMEPNTAKIIDRIKAINKFVEAGYEVHVNYSPVILYRDWIKHYRDLFLMLDDLVDDKHKKEVLSEVIFLTHDERRHQQNLEKGFENEHFLWAPSIQESKKTMISNADAIRYRRDLKSKMIDLFEKEHNNIVPWNTIRYIF